MVCGFKRSNTYGLSINVSEDLAIRLEQREKHADMELVTHANEYIKITMNINFLQPIRRTEIDIEARGLRGQVLLDPQVNMQCV